MLLFIISEVMVFGAFFTAYFFIRVVAGDQWFPFQGHELPVAVAGVNTAILLSSSVTMHWAETSIKNGNRFGLKAGHPLDLPARAARSSSSRSTSTSTSASPRTTSPRPRSSTA